MRELNYPSSAVESPRRVYWGAIFAGAIVSLAVLGCFGLLGAGLGLLGASAANLPRQGLGIGGGIWLLVTSIISYYFGGWIAGRLTPIGKISESVIHGIVSWGLATLVVFLVPAVLSGLMGGLYSAAAPGGAAPGTPTPGEVRTIVQAAGAIGVFGFIVLLCNAIAAGFGARVGTRVLHYVPMEEVRRHPTPAVH